MDAGANFNLGVAWMEVLTLIWHCVDAGGPIGGCQLGGRDTYSLGYIQSKPHVADDGTITLRYIGGTICHRGKPQQAHRSMRINFFCSRVEVRAFMCVGGCGGGGGAGGALLLTSRCQCQSFYGCVCKSVGNTYCECV